MAFEVIDISSWSPDQDEELGARDKMWMSASDTTGVPEVLWKEGRPADKLAEPCADLWAERIASEIAPLLGVPAAKVDLAVRGETRGVISWRIGGVLRHGNELLNGLYEDYEADAKGLVKGYDLPSIRTVLQPYGGWDRGLTAFDCFAGLLVFDALISNTDRHHENWAVLEEFQVLAPSYDHGASLGFNTPTNMRWSGARKFAARGRSRHFPGRLSYVDLAQSALAMLVPDIRAKWLGAVAEVDTEEVRQVAASVPAGWMSEDARTFVVELVTENRRRLLS